MKPRINSVGAMFALVIGTALMKKTINPSFIGRPPLVASTRAIKRAKRTRQEVLNSPSRVLRPWLDANRGVDKSSL